MMDALIFAGVALTIGAILLCKRVSYIAAALFAFQLVAIAGAALSAMGQPRPIWTMYPQPAEVTIISYVLDEPRAIYLWVASPTGPMAIVLPWNEQKAAQLHTAGEAAKKAHTALKGKLSKAKGRPGELGTKDDEKPIFYPEPQRPLPPKQGE